MSLWPTRSSSLQTLIQGLEGQSASSFSFLAFSVIRLDSASPVAVEDSGEAGLPSGENLLIPRSNILLRKRRAHFEGHEHIVDLVRDGSNRRLDHVREETGKGKGFTGITLHAHSVGGGASEIGLAFVEAQISPAGEESQPRKNGSRFSAQDDTTQGIQEEEDGGEVLDPHLHQTLEDGDGMFGNELFECDEESCLD